MRSRLISTLIMGYRKKGRSNRGGSAGVSQRCRKECMCCAAMDANLQIRKRDLIKTRPEGAFVSTIPILTSITSLSSIIIKCVLIPLAEPVYPVLFNNYWPYLETRNLVRWRVWSILRRLENSSSDNLSHYWQPRVSIYLDGHDPLTPYQYKSFLTYLGLLLSFENSCWVAMFPKCKTSKLKEKSSSLLGRCHGTTQHVWCFMRCCSHTISLTLFATRYPENLGWHFKVSRGVLRKSPAMSAFHKFMVAETEIVSSER